MIARSLSELAQTIRSKNAGVAQVTFDIVFSDSETYEKVMKSGVLTKDSIAKFYGIELERISHFVQFDAANAVKFTIYRSAPAGSPGESDVLGCQYYGPLLGLEVPWE